MSNKVNDFVKVVDFTATSALFMSDLNIAQEEITPESDRGFVVWTTDVAGVPTLPTITGALVRLKRYIWARITTTGVKLYLWTDTATSDSVYQKWCEITANYAAEIVEPSALSGSVAGYGLHLNTSSGLSVRISVASIEALRAVAASDLLDGTLCYVAGYTTENDGGGGWFYKRTGSPTDDGGRYIVYDATNYWERLIPENGLYKPEFFGATGDGVTDDTEAIRACLAAYNRVDLGPNTYIVQSFGGAGSAIPIFNSGALLQGAGMDSTIIKLKANASGPPVSTNWFSMIQNATWVGANPVAVNDCVFRDFTLDCNFDNQSGKPCTIAGINIVGSHNVAERIKVIHFGVGVTNYECFVLYFQMWSGSTDMRGSRISGCEITDPGSRAGSIAELSLFAISSYPGAVPDYDNIQQQPIIENCRAYNVRCSSTQTSIVHAISLSGVQNAIVRGNQVTDVDGVGFYIQNYHNVGILVENNIFWNVHYGVNFVCAEEVVSGSPAISVVENDTWIKDAVFRGNIFRTLDTFDATWAIPHSCVGAFLYQGAHQHKAGAAHYNPMDGVIFDSNLFIGRSFLVGAARSYPQGVHILTDSTNYLVTFKNNIFDVPDTWNDTTDYSHTNIPYEDSITVALDTSYSTSSLQTYGNKTYSGELCRIKLYKGAYDDATYKRTNWYNLSSTAAPSEFPPNLETLNFNEASSRVFLPIKTATAVASGDIDEGKTYRVYSPTGDPAAHIDYNSVSYFDDEVHDTFVGVAGVTTYTTGVDAVVYEAYPAHWKELGVERDLAKTSVDVAAGVYTHILSLNSEDYQLEQLVQIDFDATATDKTVQLPDPALFSGRVFRLVVTRESVTNKVSLTCTPSLTAPNPALIMSNAAEQPVLSLDIISNTTGARLKAMTLMSNGVYWFIMT